MINLRTYTRFSIGHSICDLDKVVEQAIKDGDSHVAILDKGGLHSTIYLAEKCIEAKLKPMIGYELDTYTTLWPTTHKALRRLNQIATSNSKGLFNLSSSKKEKNVGLVAVTSNVGSIVALKQQFDEVYLEVNEKNYNKATSYTAVDVKVIPTSDVLYATQDEALAHDYFHNYIHKDKVHLDSDTYYLKNKKHFEKWAPAEWINNAYELAARVNIDVVLGKLRLPEYDKAPKGMTNYEYLEYKCRERLDNLANKNKLKAGVSSFEYQDRLTHELNDVKDAHLESYFLIVEDICDFCVNNDIKKGRGRGSGAGSLICYLLNITGVDPIKYGLIWERFYNAGRAGALPDIDTDFEKERREEVIEYISERWGADRVFQISTFGSFAAKAALQAVLKIGGCSFGESKEISKLVHHKASSIEEAIKLSKDLAAEASRRRAMFSIAKQIEGTYHSTGKHAAGVIISDEPYTDGGIPMLWHEDSERYVSAYDLGAVESYGLLKVDVLGLNTLNIIKRAERLVKERHDSSFSIEDIDLEDQDVYENIFHTGNTKCIFQLESQIGQKYSKLVKPTNIEELSDLVTVVRPGAMDSGQTQHYLDVRDGKKKNSYPHHGLAKILDKTNGACIYQEQVMFICTDIAGLDLKTADNIRRAAGKKKESLMNKMKSVFMDGCTSESVPTDVGETLWSWIVKFSGYGFNKSHGICYAFLSYETAYLKHHYPTEFYDASCAYAIGDLHRTEHERLRETIYDAKMHNVDILLPSIQECNAQFKIIDKGKIRYGLTWIKYVGDGQIPIIEKCKDASSYSEFLDKALANGLKKNVLEALICAGALDHFGQTRNAMLADYELIKALTDREYDAVIKESNSSNKKPLMILNEMVNEDNVDERKAAKLIVPNIRRRAKLRDIVAAHKSKDKFESVGQIAMYERHFLGCEISVSEADGVFASITHNLLELKKIPQGAQMKVRSALRIDKVRKTLTKKGKNPGQEMAFITGSDGHAIYDQIIIFPSQFSRFKNLLDEGRVIYVDGQLSNTGGLIVNNLGIL